MQRGNGASFFRVECFDIWDVFGNWETEPGFTGSLVRLRNAAVLKSCFPLGLPLALGQERKLHFFIIDVVVIIIYSFPLFSVSKPLSRSERSRWSWLALPGPLSLNDMISHRSHQRKESQIVLTAVTARPGCGALEENVYVLNALSRCGQH